MTVGALLLSVRVPQQNLRCKKLTQDTQRHAEFGCIAHGSLYDLQAGARPVQAAWGAAARRHLRGYRAMKSACLRRSPCEAGARSPHDSHGCGDLCTLHNSSCLRRGTLSPQFVGFPVGLLELQDAGRRLRSSAPRFRCTPCSRRVFSFFLCFTLQRDATPDTGFWSFRHGRLPGNLPFVLLCTANLEASAPGASDCTGWRDQSVNLLLQSFIFRLRIRGVRTSPNVDLDLHHRASRNSHPRQSWQV